MTQPQNPLTIPARTLVGTNTSSAAAPANSGAKTAGSVSGVVSNAPAPGVATAAHASDLVAIPAFRDTVTRTNGVVILTNSDPTVSAVATAAVADGIVRDHAIADQPVGQISKITFLHPSGPRGPVPLRAFVSSHARAKLHEVHLIHCSRLTLVPEGVHILVNQLNPGECVLAQVECKDLTREAAIVALAELNARVRELGALLVIFVFHTKKQDVSWLQEHCGVFVEVGKCEPGPDAQAAVVLTNVSLSCWHPHGIGRVMVEAFLGADNAWTYRSEPFIAERAVIRLAWSLCFKKVKFEQIKEIIGIDKSNISRGLASLLIPPDNTVGLVPPSGSRKRWISRYPEVETIWPVSKPNQSTGTGVAGEAANASGPSKTDSAGRVPKIASASDRPPPATPNGKP
jgi:hypothetical protein